MTHLVSTPKTAAALLAGVAAAGAVAGLGGAPVAGATCFSAFGLGNTAECTSTIGSVAIAIGTGAAAYADGLLGAAFAFGTGSVAATVDSGIGNFAVSLGDSVSSVAGGYLSIAVAGGVNTGAAAVAFPGTASIANIAVTLGNNDDTDVTAAGVGNVALNAFGSGSIAARGYFSTALNVGGRALVESAGLLTSATNLFGTDNIVYAADPGGTTGTASLAFSVFSNSTTVSAGPGPLAIAGSIAQTGALVTKSGPGININGLVIGGAAAVPSPAAATHQSRQARPGAAATKAGAPRSAAARRTAQD